MRYYLALDLAMVNIGWAIFDSENFELIRTGTFQNPKLVDDKMIDLTHRAALMFRFADRIIEEVNEQIIGVIAERPHGTRSVSDAMTFGVVASFCAYMSEIKHMNMIYVGVQEIKRFNNEIIPEDMDPKTKSKIVARELESLDLPEHEADAVCAFHFWQTLLPKT